MFSVDLLPSSELVLQKLGINSDTLKLRKVSLQQRAHYRAIINWLTKYKAQSNVSNLEKVKGYLETFHHLCQIKDWRAAKEISAIHLNTSTNDELHEYLHIWGYYQEQISMYKQLIGKLDSNLDSAVFNGLGIAHHSLGQYQEAINYHKIDLEIGQTSGNLEAQVTALGNIALAYHFLKDYEMANEYHRNCLDLIDDIKDQNKKGAILGNLGLTYRALGQHEKALDYHQKHLAIACQANDLVGQGAALGNLGNIYSSLGHPNKALECYQRYLEISVELDDRWGKGAALHNLASFHRNQGNLEQALLFAMKSLLIFDSLQLATHKSLQSIQRIKEEIDFEVYQEIVNRQLRIIAAEEGEQAFTRLIEFLAEN